MDGNNIKRDAGIPETQPQLVGVSKNPSGALGARNVVEKQASTLLSNRPQDGRRVCRKGPSEEDVQVIVLLR